MNRVLTIISIAMLLLISCGEKEKIVEVPADCPPSAPTGVFSINLDGIVTICWYENPESDVEGYDVYRGTALYGAYDIIGSVGADASSSGQYCFDDLETFNGQRYYYAVAAYDGAGNQSDLSYEEVTGTPRPEGLLMTLYNAASLPNQSGFDFYPGLSNVVQAYDALTTDIYFGVVGEASLLIARRAGVEIQDYGYVGDFDAINYAPNDGWSPSRSAEAVAGHIYILRLTETDGFHFAKIYVREVVAGNFVTFDWAFQTDPGNPDLAPPAPGRGAGTSRGADCEGAQPGLKKEAELTADAAIPPIVERVTETRDFELRHRNTE